MTSTTKAHLALLSTNLFFALNYNAIKFLTQNKIAGPFGINVIRVGVCVILLWILFLFKPVKTIMPWKDLGKVALCALSAIAINQMLFIKGLSYTSPVHAALLTLISPILITIFAASLLRERITILKVCGLALAFGGAALLLSGKESHSADNYLLGDLLIIGSSVAYTIYFILVKPLMDTYSPMMITRMVFTFGLLMIWPFCLKEFSAISFGTLSYKEWMLLFLIVVPGTFLAYVFNVYGIKILNASKAGAYIYTQPLFAGVLAVLFLNESITFNKILATVLIFSGLYLSQKRLQKNKPLIQSPTKKL